MTPPISTTSLSPPITPQETAQESITHKSENLTKGDISKPGAGVLGTTLSGKKLRIRSYPTFESLEEERRYRKEHLAGAFRM
jgi:hypothetical protein